MRVTVVLKYQLNQLARVLYMMSGYTVPEGYDFSKAKHPTEKLMWEQAKISYEFWIEKKAAA